MMEFTTPPSYGSTTVTIGGIATDNKILFAGAQDHVKHTNPKVDTEIGWPAPESAEFQWRENNTTEPSAQSATISGSLGPRADRVDVLAHIPAFLKIIVAQAAGSKPFIYQYVPETELSLSTETEKDQRIKGKAYMEATFITE